MVMVPTALALVVSAPLQLAAAAGVELSGGYDSTVLNPLTLSFGDGGILRTAVDVQVGHRTETLRHTLRARGEFYFLGGEGRGVDQGDLTSLNRYSLVWEPSERWRVSLDAGYNVGQSALLFQRTFDPAASFFRGVFGEYMVNGTLTRALGDNARLVWSSGLTGRHTISIPAGAPRADQAVVTTGLMGSGEVGESNTFGATSNVQAMQIVGLGDWLLRSTTFATWRHTWSEHANSSLSAGLDLLQDQNDATRSTWMPGPYVSATWQQVFPDANLAVMLRAHYEFTTVNSVRCAALTAQGTCPPGQVIAGGAGRVGGGGLQMLWKPFEANLVFSGEAGGDYGVTVNITPEAAAAGRTDTQDVANANFTASAGARWIFTRGVSAFARYTFLYQHVEQPAWFPDIVRHVAMVGVSFLVFAGDAEELFGVMPLEESEAAQAIRSASQSSGDAEPADGDRVSDGVGDGVLDDGASDDPQPTRPTQPTTPATAGRPQQPRQPQQEPEEGSTGRPVQPRQPWQNGASAGPPTPGAAGTSNTSGTTNPAP